MFRRRKIGSANTESPADIVGKLLSGLAVKLIFCVVLSVAVYFFFTYVLFNFINFLIENITLGTPVDKDDTYFLIVMIFALIVVNYIVLRDWLRKR
jgi:hypothetical protein